MLFKAAALIVLFLGFAITPAAFQCVFSVSAAASAARVGVPFTARIVTHTFSAATGDISARLGRFLLLQAAILSPFLQIFSALLFLEAFEF